MTLRIGVIGAGIMGSDHATILHRWISGAEASMIVDIDADRARQLSEQVAASWSSDAAELIEDSDAVIIASHDSTHPELVLACLAAGKPVMCEKPLAPTLAEAIEVYQAEQELIAQRGGPGLVSMGFMRRFDPAYVELKNALHSGSHGPALLLHCVSRTVTSGPGSTSRSSVTNSAIHELDIVPWLLDSPVVEAAWQAPRSSSLAEGLQDPQIILLRTADGVLATIETFINARYGYDIRCEVVAETGVIALRDSAAITTFSGKSISTSLAADWRPRFADAYRLELQTWVDALNNGLVSSLPSTADAVRANAVADAVITSMESGGSFVSVPNPFVGSKSRRR
jgi:myo-inositol 2-dehydrogenase / D-chiro-inositol 1-dehydrogenase